MQESLAYYCNSSCCDTHNRLAVPEILSSHRRCSRYRILKGWGVDESKLYPLYWWESIELDGITYTLTPAQHYTGRNPLKMNVTLWSGLHIKNSEHSVYYSGDTGYYDVFEQVYERLGETELMLADSGQYDSGWAETHMFPEEAVQAAKDVHAKWMIPVHWVMSLS